MSSGTGQSSPISVFGAEASVCDAEALTKWLAPSAGCRFFRSGSPRPATNPAIYDSNSIHQDATALVLVASVSTQSPLHSPRPRTAKPLANCSRWSAGLLDRAIIQKFCCQAITRGSLQVHRSDGFWGEADATGIWSGRADNRISTLGSCAPLSDSRNPNGRATARDMED